MELAICPWKRVLGKMALPWVFLTVPKRALVASFTTPSAMLKLQPPLACRSSLSSVWRRYVSQYPFPDESGCHNHPVNVMEDMDGADWDNRINLQAKWPNEKKGWQRKVGWKDTPYGVGLFAAEDIPANTILRIGKNGSNLMQFRSVDEIEKFCNKGRDNAEYISRLHYVKDYLWGYSPDNTDEQGYDLSSTTDTIDNNKRFFGMWIPGNGLNHSRQPNTVYRTRKGGTQEGIDLVALCDIQAGEELYDDYRRHGKAPSWLSDFANEKQVTLNFADCNDFVNMEEKD